MNPRPRIAVVSPFIDKRHGTERVIAEQIARLAGQYGWEIHIFSQRVEDLPGVRRAGAAPSADSLTWHRVPRIPGPHLLGYLWWYQANRIWRWWARRIQGVRFDLVYSPGINCSDADAIAVHIVFHEFCRLVGEESTLSKVPLRAWPRTLHRRIYYSLIMALEKRIYQDRRVHLSAVSGLVAGQLARYFGRNDVSVISNAVDAQQFSPEIRKSRRASARVELNFAENDFVLLLIGNDWKKKGLTCLLESLTHLDCTRIRLLVVGTDIVSPYEALVREYRLQDKVFFCPPRPDVQYYYAATDAYVGPSLEDAFSLPPAEAMACGLPVIVSRQAGVSEWITPGVEGLILEDAADPKELAGLIRRLQEEPSLGSILGMNAARTARQHTWDRNTEQLREFLLPLLNRTNV